MAKKKIRLDLEEDELRLIVWLLFPHGIDAPPAVCDIPPMLTRVERLHGKLKTALARAEKLK